MNKDSCVSMAMRPALFAKTPESVDKFSNMSFSGKANDKNLKKSTSLSRTVPKEGATQITSRFAPKIDNNKERRTSKLSQEYKK